MGPTSGKSEPGCSVSPSPVHRAVVVETKKIGNGKLAFRLRCCDDPDTDSWATLHMRPGVDVAKRKQEEIARIEAEHEAIIMAERELAKQ